MARGEKKRKYYTIKGETKYLSQWCDLYKVSFRLVARRLELGWCIEDALTKPPGIRGLTRRRPRNYLEHEGQKRTMKEWADLKGISIETIRCRLQSGWTIAQALTIPSNGKDKEQLLKREIFILIRSALSKKPMLMQDLVDQITQESPIATDRLIREEAWRMLEDKELFLNKDFQLELNKIEP